MNLSLKLTSHCVKCLKYGVKDATRRLGQFLVHSAERLWFYQGNLAMSAASSYFKFTLGIEYFSTAEAVRCYMLIIYCSR